MAWHLVDGIRLPDAVGGHPALDFCNTRAGWGGERPKEYLTSPQVLPLWCGDVGLIGPSAVSTHRSRCTAEDLDRALALREAIYDVVAGSRRPESWRLVSAEAARARGAMRLVPAAAGGAPARWEPAADAPDLPLLALAAAAGELLTSPAGGCVAACPGSGCGWVFTDPRRRRRWCSMAWCGNRAKAIRYAERRRTG